MPAVPAIKRNAGRRKKVGMSRVGKASQGSFKKPNVPRRKSRRFLRCTCNCSIHADKKGCGGIMSLLCSSREILSGPMPPTTGTMYWLKSDMLKCRCGFCYRERLNSPVMVLSSAALALKMGLTKVGGGGYAYVEQATPKEAGKSGQQQMDLDQEPSTSAQALRKLAELKLDQAEGKPAEVQKIWTRSQVNLAQANLEPRQGTSTPAQKKLAREQISMESRQGNSSQFYKNWGQAKGNLGQRQEKEVGTNNTLLRELLSTGPAVPPNMDVESISDILKELFIKEDVAAAAQMNGQVSGNGGMGDAGAAGGSNEQTAMEECKDAETDMMDRILRSLLAAPPMATPRSGRMMTSIFNPTEAEAAAGSSMGRSQF